MPLQKNKTKNIQRYQKVSSKIREKKQVELRSDDISDADISVIDVPHPPSESPIKSKSSVNLRNRNYHGRLELELLASSGDSDDSLKIFDESSKNKTKSKKSQCNSQMPEELSRDIENLKISENSINTRSRYRRVSKLECKKSEVPKMILKRIEGDNVAWVITVKSYLRDLSLNKIIDFNQITYSNGKMKSKVVKNSQDATSTPSKRTRATSRVSIIEDYQTPQKTRSSSRVKTQSTPMSDGGRYLRERNSNVNYNENHLLEEKTVPSKRQIENEEERESIENEVFISPRKRGRRSRKDLSLEFNDPADSTPKSCRESLQRRVSSRGRRSIAAVNDDFIYEVKTPTKKVSTATSKRVSVSERKRAVTPEKDITTTPKKNMSTTPRKSLRTPKSNTFISKSTRTLTPSMHQRNANVVKPKTSLQECRTRLHVGYVPKSLPCREAEFNNIFTFLQSKLSEETGGCIYISGVPGTGKTATVNEVIACLKKLESQNELPTFKFVDINGMKLTEPRQAYVQIQKKMTGVTTSWENAQRKLQEIFQTSNSRRPMTLLLVDEMDLLCTKRQDVVYNLLDWPTYKSSRLIVITIANTMDLPERVLMGRVTSRLGLTRLTFQPYEYKQLQEIVKTRLKDSEAFNLKAIELVSRKIASISGDARRALDICRRATEIAESNNEDCVSMNDVTAALDEMIANPRVQAIKCCSVMEQKFLEAVCSEVQRTGLEQTTFKNIYRQFSTLCHFEREHVPNVTQTLEICRKLASWRLILCQSGADLYQNILLNVSLDDVYFSKKKIT